MSFEHHHHHIDRPHLLVSNNRLIIALHYRFLDCLFSSSEVGMTAEQLFVESSKKENKNEQSTSSDDSGQ